jgi:hypothetical protein
MLPRQRNINATSWHESGSEGGQQSPKCHPKMAGEGAECSWAGEKGFCRRLPPSEKRSKANFREAVSRCLDPENVLSATVRQCWMFSRCACGECMVACNALDNHKHEGGNLDEKKDDRQTRSHSRLSA